jgi:hypothetical protein
MPHVTEKFRNKVNSEKELGTQHNEGPHRGAADRRSAARANLAQPMNTQG